MLAIIRDDAWDVLNMQHITPNSKRWDHSYTPGSIKRLKDPPTWLKVATTLEKPPTPTHVNDRGFVDSTSRQQYIGGLVQVSEWVI